MNERFFCFSCMNELSAADEVCSACGHDNHSRQNGPGMLQDVLLKGRYHVGRVLGSGGFGVSRGKAAELIAAGKVELNWRVCQKADKTVAEGDVVSCRGFGKFEVAEVGGLSKKGRTNLLLKRYE